MARAYADPASGKDHLPRKVADRARRGVEADVVPLKACERLIKRVDEPCPTGRIQEPRDGFNFLPTGS